jgi:hypothetical protein
MILTCPASPSSWRPGKLQVTPRGRHFRHPQPGLGGVTSAAAHRLAVQGNDPPPAHRRLGVCSSPAADSGIRLIAIQPLHRAADGRLTGPAATHLQRGKNLIRGVGDPLADRGERTAAREHRAGRQHQDHTDLVPHTPPGPRVRHLRQCSHHTRGRDPADIGSGDQLRKDRMDRR